MQTVDQIEDDISDEALEAAGMEAAGAWTFICTSGIQCRQVLGDDGHLKPDWMKGLAVTSPDRTTAAS